MDIAAILLDRKGVPENTDLNPLLDITIQKVRQFTDRIYILPGLEKPGVKPLNFTTSAEFLDFLSRELQGQQVLILNAYSPLLDTAATASMLKEQTDLAFDYTYPENLPKGLLPEVIQPDIAEFIRETLPAQLPLFRDSIRETFESDISSYDTNIFIHPSRMVKYRINFVPDNYNNYLATRAILEKHGAEQTIESLEALIAQEPELIRQRPTYYEIELTTERERGEIFAGNLFSRAGEMIPDTFAQILDQISGFSHNPVVNLGLYGEPFLHSQFGQILEIIDRYPNIRFLFESRGIITNFAPVAQALERPNVEILFDISASDPQTFEKLKKPLNPLLPFEGLDELTRKIKELPHKEKIYPQFTRSTVNEDELMQFYRVWQDYSDHIVIKKLDTWGGLKDSLRSVDLSPMERFACLHLKHDLFVFMNGDTGLCRQDCEGKFSAGNILRDGLESCWNNLKPHYHAHWAGKFDTPSLCQGCDEWWIFNF